MSLSISVVLFDVDGTIVDSAPAVMNAFRGALSDYDLPIPDDQRLRTYVGPPLWYSFSDLGYEGELLANLVSGYRARYQAHYLDPEPFPGVIELLHDLHRAGIPLATATSKQAPMALAQMEHLGLSEVFDVIAGATPDPASSKATVIREALTRLEARGGDAGSGVIEDDGHSRGRGAIGCAGCGRVAPRHCGRFDLGCARRTRSRNPGDRRWLGLRNRGWPQRGGCRVRDGRGAAFLHTRWGGKARTLTKIS